MPQEPLCQTSTRPEHSLSPPLSRSFSLSEKAAALPVTALVGGRKPWEPKGRGQADVPVQGAAVGQLLGLFPAEATMGSYSSGTAGGGLVPKHEYLRFFLSQSNDKRPQKLHHLLG